MAITEAQNQPAPADGSVPEDNPAARPPLWWYAQKQPTTAPGAQLCTSPTLDAPFLKNPPLDDLILAFDEGQ